jgi:hypothetical protein
MEVLSMGILRGSIWGNVEKPAIGGLLGHVLHQFIGDLSFWMMKIPSFKSEQCVEVGRKITKVRDGAIAWKNAFFDGLISMLKKNLQESLFSVGWGHSKCKLCNCSPVTVRIWSA